MVSARTRARSWALTLLYGWEASGADTPRGFFAEAMERRRMSPRYRPYVARLIEVVERHQTEIDALISTHAANWRLERLDAIDRNILRIGIAELRWIDDVPPKVAIHESVRLATKYGGEDSPGFVNGVLDAVFKEPREQ